MLKKIGKIVGIVFSSIIGLVLFVLLALNLLKFALYAEYYGINENVCTNPGLNEGAVPQGIAVSEDEDLILTTAYMADDSASRIYITNSKNKSKYVTLSKNGEPFTGHVGGISLTGNRVFISNGDRIYELDLQKLLTSEDYDIGSGIKVNNQASFTYADDKYLYVGEFNYSYYECEHPFGDNMAICSVYDLNDLTKPVKIYSIPDKVQGFCTTDEGKIILSTSWGVNDSYFYVYDMDSLEKCGTLDGADVYYLGQAERSIKAPAMSEDLSYANGKVYTMFESACNKYIFGKFFFAFKVVSLDL